MSLVRKHFKLFLFFLFFFPSLLLITDYDVKLKAEEANVGGIKYGTIKFPTVTSTLFPTPTSILNLPTGLGSPHLSILTPTQPTGFPTPTPMSNLPTKNYVYFGQCDNDLGSLMLPVQDGNKKCTLCGAGCGPTSLAMAFSNSKYNSQKKIFTPVEVVNTFRQKGLYLGCQGSKMWQFDKIVKEFGFNQVGGIYSLDNSPGSLRLLQGFKQAGWEEIVLFKHCYQSTGKCYGHYVYITDVVGDKLYALDSWYGRHTRKPIDVLHISGVSVTLRYVFIFKP